MNCFIVENVNLMKLFLTAGLNKICLRQTLGPDAADGGGGGNKTFHQGLLH